jgi:hypothetical protein
LYDFKGKNHCREIPLGAFFAVSPQKTGLSAPIPRKRLRRFLWDFRFYPLRGPKSASLPILGIENSAVHGASSSGGLIHH